MCPEARVLLARMLNGTPGNGLHCRVPFPTATRPNDTSRCAPGWTRSLQEERPGDHGLLHGPVAVWPPALGGQAPGPRLRPGRQTQVSRALPLEFHPGSLGLTAVLWTYWQKQM